MYFPSSSSLSLSPLSLMATIIRTPFLVLPPSTVTVKALTASRAPLVLPIKQRLPWRRPHLKLSRASNSHLRLSGFRPLASHGEAADTQDVVVEEKPIQEDSDEEIAVEDTASDGGSVDTEVKAASVVMALLQSYQEALVNEDQQRVADIESFLQSIEDERKSLANKVAALSVELSSERERVLRISADFDNFRKRTERERLSLMTNVQGEVVESVLPVVDNFDRAKIQIKLETEGEEKISNSYQSIYKQLQEILNSLGVEAVETVGHAFDPLLHEAIMQEDSKEFEEGIILQEFRKGFKLGERLLRPSMVKVSAGPGPAKPEAEDKPVEEEAEEASQESTEGGEDSA